MEFKFRPHNNSPKPPIRNTCTFQVKNSFMYGRYNELATRPSSRKLPPKNPTGCPTRRKGFLMWAMVEDGGGEGGQ